MDANLPGAFYRMRRVRGLGTSRIRHPRRNPSPFALLRSRRHRKDRILRYIILPGIVALTVLGIYFLLRN